MALLRPATSSRCMGASHHHTRPLGLLRPSMYSSKLQRAVIRGALMRSEDDDLLLSSGCPVPKEQQPIHELKQLQGMFLFDWATMPLPAFAQKLASVWFGFFLFLAMPVSAVTFDLHKELLQCLTAASAGSSFIVTVLVWRLYLGWQHVGDRLISATIEYEETGWYDGQVWVKTPQVLMRDRLMSNHTVKPALARLKRTLLGLGGSLVASVLLLSTLNPAPVNSAAYYGDSTFSTSFAAAMRSQSAGQTVKYEDTIAKYEPWVLQEDQQSAADAESNDTDDVSSRFDMRSHMMLQ
eukprot:GHRR01002313.1.p1 GENE.GHRR01002313.1~~GHRR01002313.1.p1  ORF type:complete len:295 (+),score=100.52 GHRR01002313.1:279-1163(+)